MTHHVTNNAKNVLPFPDRRAPTDECAEDTRYVVTAMGHRLKADPEDAHMRWGWFCLGGALGGLAVFVISLAVL